MRYAAGLPHAVIYVVYSGYNVEIWIGNLSAMKVPSLVATQISTAFVRGAEPPHAPCIILGATAFVNSNQQGVQSAFDQVCFLWVGIG